MFIDASMSLPFSVFMRCQLNRLQKGQMIDEWFPLSSYVPLKGIEPGSLRVRARYSVEKIMPEEEYNEFKEVWTTEKWLWLQRLLTIYSVVDFILCPCCASFADNLAEGVLCRLCFGTCVRSGPLLTGKSPPADLQAREDWSPTTQDTQWQRD